MARFCFYCGRELSSGEKCYCRNTSSPFSQAKAAENQESAAEDKNRSSSGSEGKPATGKAPKAKQQKGAFHDFFQSGHPFSASAAKKRAKARVKPKKHARPVYQKAKAAASDFQFTPQTIFPTLQKLGLFLFKPADSIRQTIQSGSQRFVLLILVAEGICGGFFLLAATRQAILHTMLALNIAQSAQDTSFLNNFFIFMQGFGISLVSSLLIVLLYQLVLRYLFRQPAGFIQILIGLSPSFLYFSLFMLIGLLTFPASFFSAVMMVLTGFVIAALTQYLALRQISGFDDNRCLIMVAFVNLLFTGILAMLLNLSLPVLRALMDQSITI